MVRQKNSETIDTLSRLASAFALVILSACTSVPFDYPKQLQYAQPAPAPDHGTMARSARELTANHPGKSAFIPLVEGNDALGARLRMIEAAQDHLDIQYFLIKPDMAGSIFAGALLEAADRGVKIRFLLDDIFTTASDEQLSLLDSHPNIEIRIFNPLARGTPTAVSFAFDFGRVNRRMHNKFFGADSSFAIIGGRNIADEYFQIGTDAEFADFDLTAVGPVVGELAKTFDLFWNDARAVPLEAFIDNTDDLDFPEIEAGIRRRASEGSRDIYKDAVNSQYLREVSEGHVQPDFAYSEVVTDLPEKLRQPKNSGYNALYTEIQRRMLAAEEEVIILTPYFVPRKEGVEFYKRLRAEGKRVVVITNSLAATNHSYVHGGYFPYRKELLEAGVQIYEVRADAPEVLDPEQAGVKLTMHTKLAIIDRKTFFVGSLNFDPRSIEINTELGVFIESPAIAKNTVSGLSDGINNYTYTLRLDQNGDIVWLYKGSDPQGVETSEPGASGTDKFIATITSILPVEGQL